MRALATGAALALSAIAAAGAAGACASDPPAALTPAAAGGRSPVRILVLTQTRGYHHASIPSAVGALRRLGATSPRYDIRFLPTARDITPAALTHASVLVLLLSTGELPLLPEGKQALVSFVRRGGGLVGFHSATDTFHRWPGFIHLIGAEFSHHPPPSIERVLVEDSRNPATRALGPAFSIREEFYIFKRNPRPRVHVLMRLDTGPRGPDRPLAWCRREGAGRIFYDALGHFPQTWEDSRQLALVAGGMAWAAGLAPATGC